MPEDVYKRQGGARMKLDKATPVDRDDLAPGQLEVTKKQVTVGCASGALVLSLIHICTRSPRAGAYVASAPSSGRRSSSVSADAVKRGTLES